MLFWIIIGLLAVMILLRCFKRKRPFYTLCWSISSGVLTLFPISFFLGQAGISLGVNGVTLVISALLGAPGTIAMACFCVFF